MVRVRLCLSRTVVLSLGITVGILLSGTSWPQQSPADWQQQVREKVQLHQLDSALGLVEQRLTQAPGDLEARGWRARLLAWLGRWAEAESEYRRVLDGAPNDTDILCGLADVLLWQDKTEQALAMVERARALAPAQTDILLRRARILQRLGNTREARRQYQEILRLSPEDQEAKSGLAGLATETKHELRLGTDISTFSFTDAAETGEVLLTSRWAERWSTALGAVFCERFGEGASRFTVSGSYHLTKNDWLTVGGAAADAHGIVPKNEAFFEYGHALRIPVRWMKGLEVSYQQRWLWYRGAHVLTLSATQMYYLPREWTWSISVTGARSGFAGTGVEWVPSGSTRLGFPVHRGITGHVGFANGTEDFAEADQVGHFSARTWFGGLKYRFAPRHDIAGYVVAQRRSQGRTQNSYGVSYGFRF